MIGKKDVGIGARGGGGGGGELFLSLPFFGGEEELYDDIILKQLNKLEKRGILAKIFGYLRIGKSIFLEKMGAYERLYE